MRDRILGKSLGSPVFHSWIHRCLVAGSLAGALCVAPRGASADSSNQYARLLGEDLDVWKNVDGKLELTQKDPDKLRHCDFHLTGLDKWHADESITFELEHDTPELKAGKHGWTEARAACASLGKIADRLEKVDRINWLIFNCRDDMTDKTGETALGRYRLARRTYDEAIAAGIPPTEVITRGGVSGTIQELFDKWCTAGQGKLQAAEDARTAPFKKLLKNDKLRIALEDTDYIMLPGGAKATPERLAATNVWFEDASPSKVCPDGAQVHVLHRYQFNAQQKLAKVTDREFCGRPPASAFH